MNKKTGLLQSCAIALALSLNPSIILANSQVVWSGQASDINVHGFCRRVTNHNGEGVMVPYAHAWEWFNHGEAFLSQTPGGVGVAGCVVPPAAIFSIPPARNKKPIVDNSDKGGNFGGPGCGGCGADQGVSSAACPGSQGGGGGGGGGGDCFAAGTMIEMHDGGTRAIEHIQVGERLKGGGRVYMTGKFYNPRVFTLNGVLVSGNHLVKSDDGWVSVRDHKNAVPVLLDVPKVYNIASTCNRIETAGMVFADFAEISGPLIEDLLIMRDERSDTRQAA